MSPKQYMAGSVPRFIRQTKLGYLPINCLIGSRAVTGDNGTNLIFDVIMLPVPEFQRMKSNVGLQHAVAPTLKADAGFNPAFLIPDARHITVPPEEPDPENYARNYFMVAFGIVAPEVPKMQKPETEKPQTEIPNAGTLKTEAAPPPQKAPEMKGSPFSRNARDYTRLKE